MQNLTTLQDFFEAENQRNWETYAKFLSPDVVWELHGHITEIIRGKTAYLTRIQEAYHNTSVQFTCKQYEYNAEQSRILTYLVNDYGQVSCDIFEFKDGLIVKEFEFLL
ncbi:nuclear transport factor 2 family protein [Streptococcus ovis]|uniref:nuclear transport factor 2 family protein n=1 Tax=Streptococcus ovis TaxID=82806 RepID=UPI00036F1697|nr:nuclear transport factor 2 family protein [Streptococcus ovis]